MIRRIAWPLLALGLVFCSPALAQDQKFEMKSNVVYGKGGDKELHMDIAIPKGKGPFPAVVAIHGGSWRSGNKMMFLPLIARLAKLGYVAVTIEYRFAPKYKFPAQIEDSKCAVRYLRANAKALKIDTKKIGAIGFSAGAHLALLLGTMNKADGLEGKGGHASHSSKVQTVVNYFGPTDVRTFSGKIIEDFLGGSKKDKPEVYKKATPLLYLDKSDAPVITLHGTKDPLVPYKQALDLDKALKKLGIANQLWTAKDEGHGWGGEKLEKSAQAAIAFLDKHLKGTKTVEKKKKFY
ncbi:MAG: alpha/beta hydrolase [Planctomycetota bacterium]|nr:alpha/beta hydrolase [Planctomycetota bacterium]